MHILTYAYRGPGSTLLSYTSTSCLTRKKVFRRNNSRELSSPMITMPSRISPEEAAWGSSWEGVILFRNMPVGCFFFYHRFAGKQLASLTFFSISENLLVLGEQRSPYFQTFKGTCWSLQKLLLNASLSISCPRIFFFFLFLLYFFLLLLLCSPRPTAPPEPHRGAPPCHSHPHLVRINCLPSQPVLLIFATFALRKCDSRSNTRQ